MKIIFLDIDGVLNNAESDYITNHSTHDLSERYYIMPEKLAMISYLVEQSGASIVITSTWREKYTLDELYDKFVQQGWNHPKEVFHGVTPICQRRFTESSITKRYRDIKAWFEENETESYVIIDDVRLTDWDDFNGHLVHADSITGLTRYDLGDALKIIGRTDQKQKEHDEELDLIRRFII